MTDYKVKVDVNSQDAEKKLSSLDSKLDKVTKPKKIEIKFPDLDKIKSGFEDVNKYANIAYKAFKQFHPLGQQFSELEQNTRTVAEGLATVGRTLGGFSAYANPIRGISDGFSIVSGTINGVVESTARLGFAIFGVTQSVKLLKDAFGQAFDDTVGREVRLREQILQTATTLAGTNRVFAEGFEITDPTQKLKALEGSVNSSIERIRDRSLEIAGTTSEAVISVFNIVASQIGSFGGTMKEAEDLAVKFSGALGTLGMSDPGYARQEVSSVLMGNISSDSTLAKTIGITNADVQKARQAGKLYEYLSEKLAVFEAGQKIASKSFSGVTSNIQELAQELKRSFGSSFLDPIIKRISAFYDTVSGKGVLKELKQTAQSFGQLISGSLNTAFGTFANSPIFQAIDTSKLVSGLNKLQDILGKVAVYIQEQLARVAPSVQNIVSNVANSIAVLAKAFTEVGAAMAKLKLNEFAITIRAFSRFSEVVEGAALVYAEYLKLVEKIISTPLGTYINDLAATYKVLEQVGLVGLTQFLVALNAIRTVVPSIIQVFKTFGETVGGVMQSVATRIGALIPAITSRITTAVTTVTTVVTAGILRILTFISQLAARIEIALNVISTKLLNSSGALSNLSGPIYALSKAFGQISTAADVAATNITELGVKGQAAMTQLQKGAQQAGTAINGLGVSLRSGLAKGAQNAGSAIAGFGLTIVRGIASMALWYAAITVLVDILNKLGSWWDEFSQRQQYKQTVDELNNGFLDQVKAARAAGKALDAVTEAKKRYRLESLNTEMKKDVDEFIKLETELKKRAANLEALRRNRPRNAPLDPDKALTDLQLAQKRNPELTKQMAELDKKIKETQRLINELNGIDQSGDNTDPELRQQENKQAVQDLAKFERDTRRSIEDEVYNYRRQLQQKELEIWRTQGDIRIQQLDQQNRRLIEGVDSEARASLEALNNWISTKRKGELDIEVKKKEAQMAAVEVERALGRFRLNLEQQVAEIRKRITQYEIDVLDKRIKAEQLIANIRNGHILWEDQKSESQKGSFQNPVPSVDLRNNKGGYAGDTGLDIIGREGSDIVAALPGKIVYAERGHSAQMGQSSSSTGYKDQHSVLVELDKPFTYNGKTVRFAYYTHLQDLDPAIANKNGMRVSAGQRLGALGIANKVPHLHFGLVGDRAQNTFLTHQEIKSLFAQGGPDMPVTYGGSSGTSAASGGNFRQRYLMRLSNLEGGYGVNGSAAKNPRSNARGYFQLIPKTESWLRSTGKGAMADALLSSDFNTAAEAAYEFATLMRPVSRQLFAEGDVAGLDRMLNRLWTSLPGGSEAATGTRLAKGNAYLKGGASSPSAGSASLASIGGAPAAPNVTLNIDTSELDTVTSKLRSANEQLIQLQQSQNDINNAERFNDFIRSLDTTSTEIERVNKNFRNSQIELNAIAAASGDTIYDPDVLAVNIRQQQALAQLEQLRAARLKLIPKLNNMTPAEQTAASTKIQEAYVKDKANLDTIARKERELLSIAKDRENILQLNSIRRQSQIDFTQEQYRLESAARSALFTPDDFLAIRNEEALVALKARENEMTEGGIRPLVEAAKKSLEAFSKQLFGQAKSLAALDVVVNENRKIREIANKQLQLTLNESTERFSNLTDAMKASLPSSDFRGARRIDASREIFNEYLNLSQGGTKALSDALLQQLDKFAKQAYASADSLAALDAQLKDFNDKLGLAKESAATLVDGYKNFLKGVMQNGNFKELATQMGDAIASKFTDMALEQAFKPVQQQFENIFKTIYKVPDVEKMAQEALLNSQASLVVSLGGLKTSVDTLIRTISPATPTLPEGGPVPGAPATPGAAQSTPSEKALDKAQTDAAARVTQAGKAAEENTKKGFDFGKALQGATQAFAGVALAIAGVQQMKQGGTYNTLMGLASIFGSISSITGMFGTGGAFGPRALGGPVTSRQPYLVGESGPELFVPQTNGRVISHDRTRGMFDMTRQALSARSSSPESGNRPTPSASLQPIQVRYESQVINNVEYVTTEQYRKGMKEAAQRGQQLAYQGMQHSVKVRRRLGLA